MKRRQENPYAKRAAVVLGIFLATTAGLAGQLGNLSIGQQQAYAAKAETQSTRDLTIPAPRGTIYDKNMQPLASNRPAFRLLVHYPAYNNSTLLETLSKTLAIPAADLQQRIDKQRALPFQPVTLVEDLSQEQYSRVLEQKQSLPGIEVQPVAVRQYPQGELAAHLLGYVGAKDQEEPRGMSGLEAFYESILQGKPGERQVQVNNYAEPLSEVKTVEPQPGQSIVLTIDSKLQQTAERALEWQMHRLQTIPNVGDGHAYPNAKAGAVVVMDVQTGAILAMASRPGFDPNQFVGGISSLDWNRLRDNPFDPLLDRAVQAAYHPGSTWKMLTGAASLAAGVTDPYEQVFSGSVYKPTGQKDWVAWGHGWVDLRNALRLSSDIYFYEMGIRLGIDRQVQFAKGFGFGSPTGVDLNEEVNGFLPDEAYRNENGWQLGQTSSSAIGQIFTVTPIQLARYVTALANGGKLLQPYLVQEVRDSQGQVVRTTQPKQIGTLPVSPEAIRVVTDGMKLVNSPTGTSDFAQWPLPGIATAGKTGTAENPPHDDYGLFVGYAPADNPKIAVAVVIEQAGHGGSLSPVARTIWADYFNVKLPAGDPARVPDDFTGTATAPAKSANH